MVSGRPRGVPCESESQQGSLHDLVHPLEVRIEGLDVAGLPLHRVAMGASRLNVVSAIERHARDLGPRAWGEAAASAAAMPRDAANRSGR